jgi:hypothetical protein
MGAMTQIPIEEYLAASYSPDREFVEGVLVERNVGDWLHSQGLKLGIYSSPGDRTCGGYLGSCHYEDKDAATYAGWGVDYLKYDWCSYSDVVKYDDTVTEHYIHPYRLMQQHLQKQPRDIYYSLCQYGMKKVEQWGASLHAQSWRTTEDIEDTWESMKRIGFSQAPLYKYAGPGHWNDPDMLIVGMIPHKEAIAHFSLWSILSAPLIAGNDIRNMSPETLEILTNKEVIAVNQDPKGVQGTRYVKDGRKEVWAKPLADGSFAVVLFNRYLLPRNISFKWADLNLDWETAQVRDLWKKQDLGEFNHSFKANVEGKSAVMIIISPR